ncbi:MULTISPECIES: MFS transporter [Pseudomonas]|uniref:MFS transporter n=1 Tax=Pseudomonas sessilinigenes TaxID=658629 RepID=A0ABX8MKT4_9PSED|nr:MULTISPECIES: MFS transporter [Pseudomonas]AZC26672.1 Putative transmembrane efflux protein [Pseudomonas sessilinigenes]QIH08008.1 MFS transporter [Pseudomonas sp. BIOMIG1BAC]QXH39338.1 MFS transporter [Pseudomonas sessilinigenes]UMZ09112.1 MFS transporter [Pseudomonas sp. MPFS]
MTQTPENATLNEKRWQALAVISIIQLILLLDATVVNVALPRIKHELGLTDGSLTWVVNAYLITAGSLLLLGGRIGDAFGVRRTFQVGVVIFGAFSLLATFAQDATVLIISRAGQGVGEALASATGLAMVSLLFPSGPERGKAFGIWAALGGLGSIIGVLLSGVLTHYLSWRWVFGINVPVVLLLIVATMVMIPKFAHRVSTPLDLGNALILVVAVAATVMAVMGSGVEHLPGQRVALLVLGLLGIALVLRRCKRSENGIVPARLMTRSPRLAGYAIVAILAATSGALFYLGVLLLQEYLGLSPMQTGLAWLPFCLGFFPGIFLCQFVMQRWSPQTAAVVGLMTSAVGFALFAFGVPLHSYWLGMFPAMLVTSIGFGCVAPVAQSLATSDLSEADAGAGSGITTTIQQLFQVFGVSSLAAVALAVSDNSGAPTIAANGFVSAFALSALAMFGGALLIWAGRNALALEPAPSSPQA